MPTAVNVFYWITKPRRRVVSGEDCSVDKIRNFFSLLVFEYTFKLLKMMRKKGMGLFWNIKFKSNEKNIHHLSYC
jgi:hypothetical protein